IDKGQPVSELVESLLKTGNFQTVFELVKFVYSSSKDQVADLSIVLVHKAAVGNDKAIQILEKAGLKLTNQVSMLIKKIGIQKNPNVAVIGSLLVKNDIVYEAFVEKIKSKYSNCKFVRTNISNTIGGYYYYKRIKQQKI